MVEFLGFTFSWDQLYMFALAAFALSVSVACYYYFHISKGTDEEPASAAK